MSSDITPEAPSKAEINRYYYGLPSAPLLVARSSATTVKWQKVTVPEASRDNFWPDPVLERQLYPIVSHPIIGKWDVFKNEIIQALETLAVQWVAVDVLRLGHKLPDALIYEMRDPERPPLNILSGPVVVLISVKPGSSSWTLGYEAAMKCKDILDRHGLNDVHCEIREQNLAGTAYMPEHGKCGHSRKDFNNT